MARVGHGDGRRKKSKTGEDGSYHKSQIGPGEDGSYHKSQVGVETKEERGAKKEWI